MKYLYLILVFTCSNVFAEESYRTYVQINPSTDPGKILVIAVLSPMEGNDVNDRAMATFGISIGEKKQIIFKNKFYPNRDYIFDAHAWAKVKEKMGMTIDINVVENEVSHYKSQQVFGAWAPFNKSIQPTANAAAD